MAGADSAGKGSPTDTFKDYTDQAAILSQKRIVNKDVANSATSEVADNGRKKAFKDEATSPNSTKGGVRVSSAERAQNIYQAKRSQKQYQVDSKTKFVKPPPIIKKYQSQSDHEFNDEPL